MSDVVRRFLSETSPTRGYVQMGIEDALHIGPQERQRIIDGYPAHEREARTKGIPLLGSGRIFTVPEDSFVVRPFSIPNHYSRIVGFDLGRGNHPSATAWLALDREQDIVYLHDLELFDGSSPLAVLASAIKRRGASIPVAWPKDVLSADVGSGKPIATMLKNEGVKMLPDHAQFPDGSVSVEAGILLIQERLETGRLKIFEHVADPWLEEYRLYHRKDGRIVKEHDDALDATRYGLMMLRSAKVSGLIWDLRSGRWFDPDTGRLVEGRGSGKVRIAEGVDPNQWGED